MVNYDLVVRVIFLDFFFFQTSASIGTAPSVSTAGTTARSTTPGATTARSTTPGATIARSTTPGATPGALDPQSQSKYQQLLSVIEEMSKYSILVTNCSKRLVIYV